MPSGNCSAPRGGRHRNTGEAVERPRENQRDPERPTVAQREQEPDLERSQFPTTAVLRRPEGAQVIFLGFHLVFPPSLPLHFLRPLSVYPLSLSAGSENRFSATSVFSKIKAVFGLVFPFALFRFSFFVCCLCLLLFVFSSTVCCAKCENEMSMPGCQSFPHINCNIVQDTENTHH